MLKSIEEVYYVIDQLVQQILPVKCSPGRKQKLLLSELLTMLVEGHSRGYITAKQIYELASRELKSCWKSLPCYAQFTRAIRQVGRYVELILQVLTQINAQEIQSFCIVDSTALPVNGYNRRPNKWALHQVGTAKNMHGWYQGFKLHLIINQNYQIISLKLTQANVHDVQLLKMADFVKPVHGLLLGDKGYIMAQPWLAKLKNLGIELLTKQRENMDPYLNHYYHHLLKHRRKIESIFGTLKSRLGLIMPFSRTIESFLSHTRIAVLALMIAKM